MNTNLACCFAIVVKIHGVRGTERENKNC